MSKTCSTCKQTKGYTSFSKNRAAKDGFQNVCKECATSYYRATCDSRKTRATWLKSRYGITVEDYDSMLAGQGNSCAICGTQTPGGAGKRFHVDHCHKTGKVRGLLCVNCNSGLGKLQDSPELLQKALTYLNDQ